jgi:hypothetical protein
MKKERINFEEMLEWGDQIRIAQYMKEKGIVNPHTNKPYIPLSIRLYIIGVTKNTNMTIERGILDYLDEKKKIKERLLAHQ